jgi:hypothetical protein
MLIRAALLAWVEWTTKVAPEADRPKANHKIRAPQTAGLFRTYILL